MKKTTNILSGIFFFLCISVTQASECIEVKNRGKVSLTKLQCSTTEGIDLVGNICYDEENTYLIVQVAGQYFEYCGIKKLYAQELLKAPRKSQYLNTHIANGIFDCSIFQPPSYAGQCR